jgi:uncharacterized membrane protein
MPWLILGLLLWSGAHLFKRLAPGARAALGEPGKGAVALALVLSVVLMVVGYRAWEAPQVWVPAAANTHVNNLLVVMAFYLFAASGMRTGAARVNRHPQLTAVTLWATAHLLVNGDLASIVLFGGLGAWALAEIAVINRAEPAWTPPPPASWGKEVGAVAGTVVVVAAVGLIHGWVGPWPFG